MPTRIAFETEMRRAAVELLTDYAQDASLKLQIYRARPRSLKPPTAFVDSMSEDITWSPGQRQRLVLVSIRIVWGLFDSGEAVDQRDDFVDGFVDWCSDRPHASGPTTVNEPRRIEDDPEYVPTWLPISEQDVFFSTVISWEGFAGGY